MSPFSAVFTLTRRLLGLLGLSMMPSPDERQSRGTAPRASGESTPDRARRKPGITFAAQDRLPKLPIPELEDTCRQYVESLRLLQSEREHEDTAAAVQDFLRAEGPVLQERLRKYSTGKSSYIEQFCTDARCGALRSLTLRV